MKTTLYTILLAMTAMLVACDANYTTEAKSELVAESVKKFENPVLRKLFAENHIL